jgi:hypothetical protein
VADITSESNNKLYYNIGDQMRSQIEVPGDGSNPVPTYQSQYFDILPIPRANLYGVCNNYFGAYFLESVDSTCSQAVNLQEQCETILNPIYFTENLKVLAGEAKNSDQITVEIQDIYDIDLDTLKYSEVDQTAVGFTLGSVWDTNANTCVNFLKEVKYTMVTTNAVQAVATTEVNIIKVVKVFADLVI